MSHLQASLRERGGERDRYRDIYIHSSGSRYDVTQVKSQSR